MGLNFAHYIRCDYYAQELQYIFTNFPDLTVHLQRQVYTHWRNTRNTERKLIQRPLAWSEKLRKLRQKALPSDFEQNSVSDLWVIDRLLC